MDRLSLGGRAGAGCLRVLVLLLCGAMGGLWGQEVPRTTEEGTQESRWFDRMAEPLSWAAVEECQVKAAERTSPLGGPVLWVHVGVDHQGGEKAYPIGWPRAHFTPTGWERDWSAWDVFEFAVLVEFKGFKAPAEPISLEIGEGRNSYNRSLAVAADGQWQTVTIPIAELSKRDAGLPAAISRVRLVVSESKYRHEDVVDVYLSGFRLTRSLTCAVTALTTTTPVVFTGQPVVQLELTVVGPPEQVKRGIPFVLRRRDSGEVLRREMLPLGRGHQRYACDISELALAPGDYTLAVFEADPAQRQSADFKVVAEPWKPE